MVYDLTQAIKKLLKFSKFLSNQYSPVIYLLYSTFIDDKSLLYEFPKTLGKFWGTFKAKDIHRILWQGVPSAMHFEL